MTSERQRPFGPNRAGPVARVRDGEPGGWAAGYAEGFRDGAGAQPDRELFALIEVAWSAVRSEDSIMGDDGALYHVVRSGALPGGPAPADGGWIVTLVCGSYREVHQLDQDARVRVLVPVGLADALIVSRAGLPGCRLIATRTNPNGDPDPDLPWRTELAGLPRPAG
jgi:hypothetical protein